eukprot:CAMPEP_0174951038 /NCGR_PEP_ID=MMETSP1355-20121228/94642_1 /TAXON_ID=464990 /ORGANISM="Hemiselmis tepida, Strain CCMP443" /LENGTH=624 /DNA_ID=CAMNT_0016198679 /DNA_START=48 /DNA_END=1919 /DNA_ORIENTATION=+
MGDEEMKDKEKEEAEKATLSRGNSDASDDDDDEDGEGMEMMLSTEGSSALNIPEWNSEEPIEAQMVSLCYDQVRVQTCDFLSEFGAAEQFLIDGESMVAWALCNPLLDNTHGGQTLHAAHIIESALQSLRERGACFEIFFFEGYAPLWRQQGDLHCMARELLIKHLSLAAAQAKLEGRPQPIRAHMIPGGWWMEGHTAAWDSLLDVYGPAFIMADYGWCGSEQGGAPQAITRGFVHHCHARGLNVVTVADLNMDGSHCMSGNLIPPDEPLVRLRFQQGISVLLEKHAATLSAQENPPSNIEVPSGGGLDARGLLVAAGLRKALSSGGGGKNAQDALFCCCSALQDRLPLSQRAFPACGEAFSSWRAASDLAREGLSFLALLQRSLTAVMRAPANQAPLKAGLSKGGPLRVADAIDGRLFAVLLAKASTGALDLPAEVAAAAKAMASAAGCTAACGAKLSGGDAKASEALLSALADAAKARHEARGASLIPLSEKPLLRRVLGDMAAKLEAAEEADFDPAKVELGKYRDRRYRDVEPLGDEPDIYSFKIGEEEYVARKANKWNNVGRRAQLKARWSSGYIDSLLEGTPCRRQVIAQNMAPEEFERRRQQAVERLANDAEMERRAA